MDEFPDSGFGPSQGKVPPGHDPPLDPSGKRIKMSATTKVEGKPDTNASFTPNTGF
jgi:hypothetical protein